MIAELIDPAVLGFILVGVMLFAIFIGFPISFTLIFLGFVFGYLGFGKLVFYLMTLQFSMVMTEQTLAAVPLFVFMGIMMEQAGLMERLFSAFQLMLARVVLPGIPAVSCKPIPTDTVSFSESNCYRKSSKARPAPWHRMASTVLA